MKLYTFFRSSSSYRTRIVLNLKGINYDTQFISLAKNEQRTEAFKALNPQGFLPVLQVNDTNLIQSPAILEWLEESYPESALLPQDAIEREKVRAISAMIGCDIHPLNNKRVLEYLRQKLQLNEQQIEEWCSEWIISGFTALEEFLKAEGTVTNFCFGQQPTLADAYLVPQVYSAIRFSVDLTPFPLIQQIYQHCLTLDAFKNAAPENQQDAF